MSKKNPFQQAVVVITGASGGIGRATARAFARRGATLVLAARRREALEEVLRECEREGGRGIVVPTDVGESEQVDRLAEVAVGHYRGIDVWVNNAAVSLFGRIEDVPREDYEQVLKTNILGCVNGSRAAIRQFRRQGSGRLINVSSVVGEVGQPYTSAYVTSKWAIRGLTESLRMDLADVADITASAVLPSSIDTPIFQHAANYTGRPVKAMTPVYPPEKVAEAIVRVARSPRREVIVGNAGRMMSLTRTLAPKLGEKIMRRQVEKDHFARGDSVAAGSGNLFQAAPGAGSVRGGWIEREHGANGGKKAVVVGALAVAAPLAWYAHRRWRGAL